MWKCTKCGAKYQKPLAKCFQCNEWNSFVEEIDNIDEKISKTNVKVTEKIAKAESQRKLNNNIKEFERVLALHTKSVVLIGGEPGIGKSTLMCQLSCNINANCLYLCGEESSETVKTRIQRVNNKIPDTLNVVDFLFFETIESLINKYSPNCVILDSIHTTRTETNDSSADILMEIIKFSRQYNICFILVSHITKEGIIAGPKTLEHMVDAVLYLEGDRYSHTRCLKSIKNRFGSTGETGIFSMEPHGLVEVKNPSVLFLSNKPVSAPGSVVFPYYGGARTYLVEIQALVVESSFFNIETVGLDSKRVNMIVAILNRWCKINFYKYNICVNAVGGIKIVDPAADLAIAAALFSSLSKKSSPSNSCFFGELGLTGEVRSVQGENQRISEARRMGMNKIYTHLQMKENNANELYIINNISELTKILT